MFEVCRYSPAHHDAWNRYVAKARNATFLFYREYMDYHSDRFRDHSLMFFKGNHLHSILPAHEVGDMFCSHRGLTYGGLLMDNDVTTADVLVLFDELNEYLRKNSFRKVIYRSIPWVYHRLPAEEDLYAMFWKCGAHLSQRMSGTVIFMDEHVAWRKDHRRRLKQAQTAGIRVERDGSLAAFWPILNDNLQRKFQAQSVHTLEEIELLKSRFPDNIIQYNAYIDDAVVGGITFYVMGHVLHGQYSGTTDDGKRLGAMEAIYDKVMYHDFPHIRYLDFGTSNEQGGRVLNEGLIAHKEGYGGRTVMYDTYEWTL
ncbi:MAG: GNAT family N-acetyltransferase [Prevotella sp.]|nr:GNAT family N-acetyltransferase [Prevotella sp.]